MMQVSEMARLIVKQIDVCYSEVTALDLLDVVAEEEFNYGGVMGAAAETMRNLRNAKFSFEAAVKDNNRLAYEEFEEGAETLQIAAAAAVDDAFRRVVLYRMAKAYTETVKEFDDMADLFGYYNVL